MDREIYSFFFDILQFDISSLLSPLGAIDSIFKIKSMGSMYVCTVHNRTSMYRLCKEWARLGKGFPRYELRAATIMSF